MRHRSSTHNPLGIVGNDPQTPDEELTTANESPDPSHLENESLVGVKWHEHLRPEMACVAVGNSEAAALIWIKLASCPF